MKKTLLALALVAGALTVTPQAASAAPAKAKHAQVKRAKKFRFLGCDTSAFECQSDGTLLSGMTVFGVFINTSGNGVPNSNLCK